MQLHDLDGAVVRSDIRTYFNNLFNRIVTTRRDLRLLIN
jgi:hypothetical protein